MGKSERVRRVRGRGVGRAHCVRVRARARADIRGGVTCDRSRCLGASERETRRRRRAREKCGEVFGWIVHVLAVSDSELVETAGLDALVFLRISQFGTQLFAPLALAGVLALAAHCRRRFTRRR